MKQTIYRPHTGEDFQADELLQCPFCGYIPELKFIGNDFTKKRSVEINCTNIDCRVNVTVGGVHTKSKGVALWAIEIWNKRV